VGLERDPLSHANTTEELLERKSSGSGLEIRDYGSRDPPRDIPLLAKVGANFADLSVSIVPSLTKATEFFCFVFVCTLVSDIKEGTCAECVREQGVEKNI
jgi:hypothetical protein